MHARAVIAILLLLASRSFAGLTEEQFRSDLRYVVAQLPGAHPNLFFSMPSVAFYAAAEELDADIPRLSAEQFYTRLSAMVAMANDSHTRLMLSDSAAAALGFSALPIEFRVFADGVFVVSSPTRRAFLNGARLLAVGGIPIAGVYDRLAPVIPHVNASGLQFGVASLLSNSGVLRGIGAAAAEGPVSFRFQLRTGEQATVELSADRSALIPSVSANEGYIGPLLSHRGENYWSEYWAYARTVYVRYAQCIEMAARPASAFATSTLTLIDRNPVETVIIDLRGNGGGSETVTMPLTIGLVQRIGSLRANPRFQVYTLTDGGTESAALNTAADLKYGTIPRSMTILGPAGAPGVNAVLAGEPTGGKPAYYGGSGTLTLPQSHLSLRHATSYTPAFEGLPQGDSLYPDLPVDIRSTDYFARHDPVLAAALAHALPHPTAPTGGTTVLNAASLRFETGIAPGSYASAFGSFPVGNLRLTVNGSAAQLVAASPGQLNFLVPMDAVAGTATLQVSKDAEVVSEGLFHVTRAGPGLFVSNLADDTQPGAVLNEDNASNTSAAPAQRGAVLQLFGTGNGPLDSSNVAPVTVWIANRPAEVLYSGFAPGLQGLWQINVRIPNEAEIEKQVPAFVSTEGFVSNAVSLFVAAPRIAEK